ncbi:MAG: cation diffusion facilitator family transporter [Actinomycetota bacterium]
MPTQPPPSPNSRRVRHAALASLAITVVMVAAKLSVGLATGSLAVLSEAANSALDLGTASVTFFAVRIAARPPDADHPYGHGKAENLSALLQTGVLFALAMYILYEAFGRLTGGAAAVEATWYAFVVMAAAMAVDAGRSIVLKRIAKQERSPALRADAMNFRGDLLSSATVLVGLTMVALGYPAVDAIASLAIAGYVAFMSVKLGRASVDELMDRAPAGSIERIAQIASQVPNVEEVRRVRIRYVGGEPQTDVVIAVSRLIPLETAHDVTEEVERAIRAAEPGADVVVHVEPLADETMVAQKVEAVALRQAVAAEVHNIKVAHHPDGLYVSLHARFPGRMPLEEAHELADKLEREIGREVDGVVRVDTHLEPLQEPAVGSDVTGEHNLLSDWTKTVAESQPEVRNCHEVVISRIEKGLEMIVHCEAEAQLSVKAVHDAATRIETATHQQWPQVERVTVHFEPQDH